ncbi:MAG: hypothetical protein M3N98_07525 [Actinomycetota bacterium]|nr:hypothetical protein [Actinomycetota bacterium]
MAVKLEAARFADAGPGDDGVDDELVRKLRARVARRLADTQKERERRGDPRLADSDEHALGSKLINDALEAHAHDLITRGLPPPGEHDERALRQAVFNLMFGLGRLQDHLDRTDVVNIHAAGAEPVWLDLTDGRTIRGPAVADSDEELIEFVRELGRRVGLSERLFDPAHPRINLQLPQRVQAVRGRLGMPADSAVPALAPPVGRDPG